MTDDRKPLQHTRGNAARSEEHLRHHLRVAKEALDAARTAVRKHGARCDEHDRETHEHESAQLLSAMTPQEWEQALHEKGDGDVDTANSGGGGEQS